MAATANTTFYGSRLEVARQRRGMTRVDLEVATGIDRGRLYRYEADRQTPPPEHVEAIARVTNFPVGFFYMGEMPRIDPNTVSF